MTPLAIIAALLLGALALLRWWYVVNERPQWEHRVSTFDGKSWKHYRNSIPFDGSSDYVYITPSSYFQAAADICGDEPEAAPLTGINSIHETYIMSAEEAAELRSLPVHPFPPMRLPETTSRRAGQRQTQISHGGGNQYYTELDRQHAAKLWNRGTTPRSEAAP